MAATVPRRWGELVVGLVAMTVIFGMLVVVLIAAGVGAGGWVLAAWAVALLVIVAVSGMRSTLAPIRRELVMIGSTWSGLTGGGQEVQTVARTVTVRREDGSELSLSARGALAVQEVGDVGVALIRGKTLVGFERLDV